MRGAVLSQLGLKVGEHRMRRNYGVVYGVPFVSGRHPIQRKYIRIAGGTFCRGVFDWFAIMVCRPSRSYSLISESEIRSRTRARATSLQGVRWRGIFTS